MLRRVTLLAAIVVLLGASPDAYPPRPKGVHVHYEEGRLIDYVLGNHGGGLDLVLPSGRHDTLYIGYPNKINGHHFLCQIIPSIRVPNPGGSCDEIPPHIMAGRSLVRVAYWWSILNGRKVKVSDELTTLSN